jgi:hypothetical protein
MVKTTVQYGFAYIGLLFLVAAISVSMAVVSQNEDINIKREKEQDWLFIGNQYQRAIASYYNNSPNGIKTLPIKLEDLLLDSRFIAPVRHLRKLYGDPLNHQQDWTLIKTPDEQIIGVYSKSKDAILSKKRIFEALENLDDQVATYSEIQFVFKPKQMPEGTIRESRIDDKEEGLY